MARDRLVSSLLAATFFFLPDLVSAQQTWQAGWSFPGVGFSGGPGTVRALGKHFDEIGEGLYAGGSFNQVGGKTSLGGNFVSNIAKWDGTNWSSLGTGVSGEVRAFASHVDIDSLQPVNELFVGGSFFTAGGVTVNRIGRWKSGSWSSVGNGVDGTVNALLWSDLGIGGGPGGNLYAGGAFAQASGTPARGVAVFDGTSWAAVGGDLNGTVHALVLWNDGDGLALYAGGLFSNAAGTPVSNIARWDGVAWSALGSGVNGTVRALEIYNGELYVGGTFTMAGGQSAGNIAKWNGSSWSTLGAGIEGTVYALHREFSELFVGGDFTLAGAESVSNVAVWKMDHWEAPGGVDTAVFSITDFSGGSHAVYAGGGFLESAGSGTPERLHGIAKYRASTQSWRPLGQGLNGSINALASGGCGCGDLYAGGGFTQAGGTVAGRVARWDGDRWMRLGTTDGGVGNTVHALLVREFFADTTIVGCHEVSVDSSIIYAGGDFTTIDGIPMSKIGRWNGVTWSPLGAGVNGQVTELLMFDGDLIAGGSFSMAGAVSAARVAQWDGNAWSAMGSGFNNQVTALGEFGGELYAGGTFTMSGGTNAVRIAKWDGSSWQPLFGGVVGLNGPVYDMQVWNGELYIGGSFTQIGFDNISFVARYDGITWNPAGVLDNTVLSLEVHGGELYAGGLFTTADGQSAPYVAKWNGAVWDPVDGGLDDWGVALASAGFGNAKLYVGGSFEMAGDICSQSIAELAEAGSFGVSQTCPSGPTTGVSTPEPRAGSTFIRGFLLATGQSAFEVVLFSSAHLSLTVYDISGRKVATLCDGRRLAGTHRFTLSGGLTSGVYFGLARIRGVDGSQAGAARVVFLR